MKGAALYDLLGREVELREKRQAVLARNLEIQKVEAGLRNAAKNVGDETQKVQNNIVNVAANEANLAKKKVKECFISRLNRFAVNRLSWKET
jgi:hypothetical protein